MQEIQTALLPFDTHHRKTRQVREGLTLQEIVNEVKAPCDNFVTYVTVNGELIPTEHWGSIKPKTEAVVGVSIAPAGRRGGGKNPLATLVSIVTVVAAPYLAGQFATSAALGIFGGGVATAGQVAFASGLITAAVGVTGQLIASSLVGTPRQPSLNGTPGIQESPTQFIEGARNQINRWGVVPINLGKNRMFPPQAASPFTEAQNDEQFSRQLFCLGYGNVVVSEEKIGETLLSDFDGVQTADRFNSDLDQGTNLYTNDVFQEDLSVVLEDSSVFSARTSQVGVDEIELDITLPQGLVTFNNEGKRRTRTVIVEIRYAPTGTTTWTTQEVEFRAAQTAAIRRSVRIVTGSTGQWDVEVRRTTDKSTSDRVRDTIVWSALKSITHTNPVNLANISGKAIRIQASDQLNGAIDRYNAIVSTLIPDYDSGSGTWITRETSNPASIYRYVLQSEAFVKRLPDSRIDLTALEAWHTYCASLGLEYNRVVDYETSVQDVLNDVAAAGFATKSNVEGIYSVVVDNERPVIKGMVTPRNSWNYRGSIAYPEVPDALIIEFRNKDIGYTLDERFIYNDGFDASNATLFERIEFSSCTNANLAYIYGRRYLANLKLQPEIHTFYQDPEFLTLNRGDRFTFVSDAILVGAGYGRISSVVYDNPSSPTQITGFVLDDELTIPESTLGFATRIRYNDASDFAYHPLTLSAGQTSTFTFTTPLALSEETKIVGALCSFTELTKELDLVVLDVQVDRNQNAKIRAINYAPERLTGDTDPIPAFSSNVTLPLNTFRPEAPEQFGDVQSDESVLVRNSDGSYLTRMVIGLTNRNEREVDVLVKYRLSGTLEFQEPEVLQRNPEQLILTGLEDDTLYDFEIRYQRLTGAGLISTPLVLSNIRHIGASTIPADVSNFEVSIPNDDIAFFSWDRNPDIDIDYYQVRYSPLFTGAIWETSQILEERVFGTRLSEPFRGGTYLIKAVDLAGNVSANATTIITYDPGQILNVVETLQESTTFPGVKTNVSVSGTELIMNDTSIDGIYEFSQTIDLTSVTTASISAILVANGQFTNNVFDMTNVFAETDIFPSGDNLDLFTVDDIFGLEDMFGIGTGSFNVDLQARFTDDDPNGSPTWTDWASLITGSRRFRAVQFRLVMQSLQANITPAVQQLSVTIDMPDRIVRGEDLTVPVGGVTINYSPAFQANPAVNITVQDGDAADRIEFTSKTSSGFTFRVYNDTSMSYVERTFDYISSGYGRV